jgi:hypothetical protein
VLRLVCLKAWAYPCSQPLLECSSSRRARPKIINHLLANEFYYQRPRLFSPDHNFAIPNYNPLSATKSASHLSHFFSPSIPADSRFIGVIYLLLILIPPAPHMFLTGTNFDFRLYSHFSFSKLGRYPLYAHTIRLISAPGTHSSSHLHFLHLELLSHLLIFYCCLVRFLLDLTGCTIRIRC